MALDTSGTVNTTPSATFDVAIPAHSSGDLLVVVAYKREAAASAIGISTSGWSVDQVQPSGTAGRHALIGSKVGNGSETTVRLTNMNGSAVGAKVFVIDDPDASPLVGIGGTTVSGTTTGTYGISSGSPASGDYGFAAIAFAGTTSSLSITNSYTITGSSASGGLAYKVLDSTTEDISWSWTTSRGTDAIVVVYKKAGGATVTGTASTTVPAATGTITGVRTVLGVAATVVAAAVGTISGVRTVPGTASTTVPAAVGTIAGTRTVFGAASTTVPAATGTITVGAATVTGTATTVVPAATGTIVGTRTVLGVASTTVAATTGTIVGTRTVNGTASTTIAAAVGTISGTRTVLGSAATTVPATTGTITGIRTTFGTAATTVPAATGTIVVGAPATVGTVQYQVGRITKRYQVGRITKRYQVGRVTKGPA